MLAPPESDPLPPLPGLAVVVEEQATLVHAKMQAIRTTMVLLMLESLGIELNGGSKRERSLPTLEALQKRSRLALNRFE